MDNQHDNDLDAELPPPSDSDIPPWLPGDPPTDGPPADYNPADYTEHDPEIAAAMRGPDDGAWRDNGYETPIQSREQLSHDAETFLRDFDECAHDDPGWVGRADNINLMARMYLYDKEAYFRLVRTLKYHKLTRTIDPEIKREATRIRNSGIIGPGKSALVWGTGNEDPDDKRLRIKYELPTSPCSDDDLVPEGWDFGRNGQVQHEHGGYGVYRVVTKRIDGELQTIRVPIMRGYLVIASRLINVVTDDKMIDVAYAPSINAHQWINAVVSNARLGSPRDLANELLAQGISGINAANSRDVAEYLSDYLITNAVAVNKRFVSSQMGWVDETCGYLLGKENLSESLTKFYALDAGESDLADALGKTKGTVEGWGETMALVSKYPAIEFGMYASLSAIMLEVLDAPNYILEWCGQTSTGKSIALGVAASAWGHPRTTGQGIVGTWGGTKIGIERRMAALSHMPVILDDTKTARSFGGRGDTIIPSVLYMVTAGQGDSRGSLTGTQKTLKWRTVLICTGEQKITSFDKSAGTVARVLSLWGSPFGGHTDDADKIADGCARHHGHAARIFVRWIINELNTKGTQEQWCEQWESIRAEYASKMLDHGRDKGVTNRLASPLATIELTARLFHRAIELPWKYVSPIDKLYPRLAGESGQANRYEEAYAATISWIMANESKIKEHRLTADREPPGGWMGTYQRAEMRLALNKDILDKFLRNNRFEPNATYRMWREVGLTQTDKGLATKKVMIDGDRDRMICLHATDELKGVFDGKALDNDQQRSFGDDR